MIYVNDDRILLVMKISIAITAPCSLLIPEIALYFINSPGGRLGAIAFFTFLFSFLLTWSTKARSAEIFAATAA